MSTKTATELRNWIMDSPSIPFWVSELIPTIEDKDPVDVLTMLHLLTTLWDKKVREVQGC